MKNESSLECATAQHCRIQQQLSKDQLSPFFAFFLYYLTLAWFLECLQLFKMWNFRLTHLCGRFSIKKILWNYWNDSLHVKIGVWRLWFVITTFCTLVYDEVKLDIMMEELVNKKYCGKDSILELL